MMQPEVYYGEYYEVETTAGTEIVPVDVCGIVESVDELADFLEGKPYADHPVYSKGYLARLTMPGYLDSTPWGAYDSEEEAIADLDDMYGGTDGRYYI